MRTSNPALSDKAFQKAGTSAEPMTVMGAVTKTAILTLATVVAASVTWHYYFTGMQQAAMSAGIVAAIAAFVVALIVIFKPTFAPIGAPLYAVLEGTFLGGFSAMMEAKYGGIVMQAVLLTIGTLLALMLAYRSGLIKATENFRLGIIAATGGIALFYLASIVLSFFGIQVPLIHDNSWAGIGFTAVVVVVAALNLVLDFDFIERGAEAQAPKYMEWYAAFGTLVTLVWLYIEFLRLLAKLQSRR